MQSSKIEGTVETPKKRGLERVLDQAERILRIDKQPEYLIPAAKIKRVEANFDNDMRFGDYTIRIVPDSAKKAELGAVAHELRMELASRLHKGNAYDRFTTVRPDFKNTLGYVELRVSCASESIYNKAAPIIIAFLDECIKKYETTGK